jgi:hypothetical protein
MRHLRKFASLAAVCSITSVIAAVSGCASGSSATPSIQPSTGGPSTPIATSPGSTVTTSAPSTPIATSPGSTSQPARSPEVALVAITPSSVMGGTQASGTVTLDRASASGDIVVSLTSDTPVAVQVVGSVTIPKGLTATDFVVTTAPVTKDASVYVYASRFDAAGGGIQRRALIVVRQPQLKSISIPSQLASGQGFTGTVVISGPAPSQGFVVTLRQQPGGYLSYPATVTVGPGNDSADFQGTVGVVPSKRTGQIVAEGGGAVIPAATTLVP